MLVFLLLKNKIIHKIKLGEYMSIFIKSIIIGMLAIFPGVSGSAFAISLNLYDKIIFSLKNIKENKIFLLLVTSGIVVGVILGSNIIIYLTKFKTILYYTFIGLILGDIPFMIKKTNNRGRVRYLPLIISFLLSSITLLYCKNIFNKKVTFIKMIIGGILFSFGKIFPGVSSSFFLIIIGIYKEILILFSNPAIICTKFLYYFPFIIGALIGLLIFIKLLNYLLINKYDLLYSILIGFMLSSTISITPKFELTLPNILGVIIMITSFVISLKFKLKKEI